MSFLLPEVCLVLYGGVIHLPVSQTIMLGGGLKMATELISLVEAVRSAELSYLISYLCLVHALF